jgi:hypothetical protein
MKKDTYTDLRRKAQAIYPDDEHMQAAWLRAVMWLGERWVVLGGSREKWTQPRPKAAPINS